VSLKRYKVRVRRKTIYDVEVSAETANQAAELAQAAPAPVDPELIIEADALCQEGEPWVYGWSGDDPDNAYHGRPDGYLDTKDLLVFQRAHGNRFSREDVEVFLSRATTAIGPVRAHWNGAGTSGLSIQLCKPFGSLSTDQVARIMAPRNGA
jgi:hypothetical protein